VKSLSRPGGNITGLTTEVGVEIAGKKLEFLKELVPEATRIAWLGSEEAHFTLKQQIVDTARTLGVDLLTLEHAPNDYVGAFALMTRERTNAVFVGASTPNFVNRRLIVDLASRNRLPALYYTREFVDAGGLISYGVSFPDLNRRAALYVDKILKGAQPADLPIEQPSKFEMVINLKTAKALGLVMPPSLLARADEIIE
jgi:putative tryptophan/tyrosine transport system substrate-binding protein